MARHLEDEKLREYRLPGGVDLFVYPTKKFKTSLVNILLHRPLDEGTAPAALVPFLLRRGTRSRPDMVALARHLESLFGASFDADVLRFGERQVLSFRMDVVEDRYLFMGGRDLLRQALALLREVLVEPLLEEGCFQADVVEQERLNMLRFVRGLSDDKGRYAFDRCVKAMCSDEPYSRLEYGEAEEIEKITARSATSAWREALETAPAEIYVVGGEEPERVRDLCEEYFANLRSGEGLRAPPDPQQRTARRIRRVRETAELSQARLVMGYRTSVGYRDRLAMALVVWNCMFGGGPFSRLFREVRERRSLAYYCSSSLDRSKGVGFVQAGIDGAQAGRVERLVRQQLTELRRGRMELDELRGAKRQIKGGIRSATDSPARIAGFFQERQAGGGSRSFREAAALVDRVRRRDVAAAAESLRPDTVYLLTGTEG